MARYEFDCACGCFIIDLPMKDRNEPQVCDKCGEEMRRRTVPSNLGIFIPKRFTTSTAKTEPQSETARRTWDKTNVAHCIDP